MEVLINSDVIKIQYVKLYKRWKHTKSIGTQKKIIIKTEGGKVWKVRKKIGNLYLFIHHTLHKIVMLII